MNPSTSIFPTSRLKRKRPDSKSQSTQSALKKSKKSSIKLFQDPYKAFWDIGLSKQLFSKIFQSLYFKPPSPIQSLSIPKILDPKLKSILGIAQTGSGKTASFALPILQDLATDPYGIYALIVTPTRELAIQINEQFNVLGKGVSVRTMVCIGGDSTIEQARQFQKLPHILIATPGRLVDFLPKGATRPVCDLSRISYLVLDEADRLLEPKSHFQKEMKYIVSKCPVDENSNPKYKTLLFSATWWKDQQNLDKTCKDILNLKDDPLVIDTTQSENIYKTVESCDQRYCFVPQMVKDCYLVYLVQFFSELEITSCIIFTSTVYGSERLSLLLHELNIDNRCIHSYQSQETRMSTISEFRNNQVPILISTDISSRGLDLPTVDLVINYDVPSNPRDYVHRIGRTARFGNKGFAVTLVTQYDVVRFQHIEKLLGKSIDIIQTKEKVVLENLHTISTAAKIAIAQLDESGFKDGYESKRKFKFDHRRHDPEKQTYSVDRVLD